jgi:hypothetical protein
MPFSWSPTEFTLFVLCFMGISFVVGAICIEVYLWRR